MLLTMNEGGIQWVSAANEWWALRSASSRDAESGATTGALIAAGKYAVSLVARGCRQV